MFGDLLNQTCTIYRNNTASGYDFSTSEEGEVLEEFTELTDVSCRLEPAPTPKERFSGGLVESGIQTLFVSPDADIEEHDRVEVDGTLYRVAGIRKVYGINDLHHLEITITVVDREL